MTGAPLRVMTGTGEMIEGAMTGRGEMIEEVMTEIGEMTADMIVKEEMIEDMIRTEEITKVLIVVAEEMTGGMRVEEEETTALPMNLLVTPEMNAKNLLGLRLRLLLSHLRPRSMKSLSLRLWLPHTSLLSSRKRVLAVAVGRRRISCKDIP